MTPLVLLHGFAARGVMWEPVTRALPPGVPVFAPDLLGHGPMPVPARVVPFEAEVDRLAAAVAARGPGPRHLVGYSLGARVALGLLLRHPALFSRATLIGLAPGLSGDARTQRVAEDESLARILETEGLEAFIHVWENKPLFASQAHLPAAVLERQRAMRSSHLADGLATALRSMGTAAMPDYTSRLSEVTVPVTVVVGDGDTKFRAIAEEVCARFPVARLEMIPGCGHNPVLEAPRTSRFTAHRMTAHAAAAVTELRPSAIRAWVMAARPKTLPAAVVPVLVGSACAHIVSGFRLGPAVAALFGAVWIQIGTNLANDVFDFEKGADTAERLGPTRVVAAGLISASHVRAAMVVSFALATVAGVYLAWAAGWPVVIIGVASIASGIAYTGGPFPLGYHGLGDVFVMVFFGFVAVCGTAYVQVGSVPGVAWWASVPVGALATAILVVNNLRDRKTDVKAGKKTLAVRFGRRAGVAEYVVLLAAAFVVPVYLVLFVGLSYVVLLPLVTAPLAMALTARLNQSRGAALNTVLAGTAQLMMVFGVLFAAGLALGGLR
jgi:1,4-dihydroxy-2-naphthoate octaprenyltransferase